MKGTITIGAIVVSGVVGAAGASALAAKAIMGQAILPSPNEYLRIGLTGAEVIGFVVFCGLVIPLVWYMSRLAAKVEAHDRLIHRIESAVQSCESPECPVRKHFNTRDDD